MKKNGFLTFVTACVPGCGQMYYGYMRRGTSLALWFWGVVFVASLSGLGILAIVLPVIWAYAFFDTFNIRALTYEQRLSFPDDFLPSGQWFRDQKAEGFFRNGSTGRLFGWILIIIGALALYNTVIERYLWQLLGNIPYVMNVLHSVPAIVIAAIVIVVGVRLLRGPRPGQLNQAAPADGEDQ